jgi:hypothetical protein
MRSDVGLWLLAAAVRAAAFGLAVVEGRFPEFWEPEYMARTLLDGHGLVYPYMGGEFRAYLEPLYPIFVAAVYAISGRSVVALAVAHVVLSALVAPVVYRLARRIFSPAAAAAAGLLVAVHPGLAGYATKFHPLVLDSLLIAATTLAAVALLQLPGRGHAVVFGLALGRCTLTRPIILVVVPALLLRAAWRRPDWRVLATWALGLVVAATVVAPWAVRNYVVLGAFVPIRSSTPFVFWIGNHPGAPGGTVDPDDPRGIGSVFDRAPAEFRRRVIETPGELEKNRIFRDEALRYVAAEPGAFVVRTLRKLCNFWWFAPYQGRRYAAWQFAVYAAFYTAGLAAAVAGLVAAWRRCVPVRADALAVVLLVMGAVSMAQAAFYVEGRHRIAVEPLLATLSGAGVAALARGVLGGRARQV